MKTLILSAAAVVLSFLMANAADASDKAPSGKSGSGFQTRGGFHGQFRGHHAYSHGYRGFNQRRWFGNYGCYGHYCPTRACWYYLYQPANCYLPISVVQTYAPVAVPNAAPVANLPPNLPPVTPNLPPIQPVKPLKPVKPV